jgi:hypothetical protein
MFLDIHEAAAKVAAFAKPWPITHDSQANSVVLLSAMLDPGVGHEVELLRHCLQQHIHHIGILPRVCRFWKRGYQEAVAVGVSHKIWEHFDVGSPIMKRLLQAWQNSTPQRAVQIQNQESCPPL